MMEVIKTTCKILYVPVIERMIFAPQSIKRHSGADRGFEMLKGWYVYEYRTLGCSSQTILCNTALWLIFQT